jgi:hypothetical protein
MMTVRSKKLFPCTLHHRQHHSVMSGYKDWYNAMTSASTMVETMSKSSAQCVHQMAIYSTWFVIYSCFFLNSPLELTFWITCVLSMSSLIYACFIIKIMKFGIWDLHWNMLSETDFNLYLSAITVTSHEAQIHKKLHQVL